MSTKMEYTQQSDLEDVSPEFRKKGIKGAETPEKRNALAIQIADMIDQGKLAWASLEKRWQRNQSFYNNVPDYHYRTDPNNELPPDTPDHHMPLVQPIVDLVIESVVQPIVESDPYCFASYLGDNEGRAENVENDIHFLMERGGFEPSVWDAAQISAITGLGTLYVPFDVRTSKDYSQAKEMSGMPLNAQGASIALESGEEVDSSQIAFAGPCFYSIHPGDTVVYPLGVKEIDRMAFVGHRVPFRLQDVREKQQKGVYFNDEILSPSLTGEESAGRDSQQDLVSESLTTRTIDQTAEVWFGIAKLDLDEDGIEEKYVVTMYLDQRVLLDIQEFGRSQSLYIPARMQFEHNAYYPQGSVANSVQGNQLYYNELHNILIDAARYEAAPYTLVYGATPSDGNTVRKYNPHEVEYCENPPQTATISGSANLAALQGAIGQLERQSYAAAGLSQNDIGQQISGSMTATEASKIASYGNRRQTGYRMRFGAAVTKAAEIVLEHYRANYDLLKFLYGDLLRSSPEELSKPIVFRLAASSEAASPVQQLQMLQTFVGLFAQVKQLDPMMQGKVDFGELLQAFLDAAQVTASEKILRNDQEAGIARMLMAIQQLVAQGLQAYQETNDPQIPLVILQDITEMVNGQGESGAVSGQPGMEMDGAVPSQEGGGAY